MEVKELLHDVMNKTRIAALSAEAGGEAKPEAASRMQAVAQDAEDSYQLRRSVCDAFGTLETALSEYLEPTGESGGTATNRLAKEVEDGGQLRLTLLLPANCDTDSVREALPAALHGYVANKALADWYRLTRKADADYCEGRAAEELERAVLALCLRRRPSRPAD